MLPSQRYAQGVERGDWRDDPAQHAALAELDRIHAAIVDSDQDGWLDRLSAFWKKPEPVRGLYLWGGVGRGKTFLVDLFYDGLPLKKFAPEGRTDASLPPGGREGDRSQGERWSEGESPVPASAAHAPATPTRLLRGGGKYRIHFHRFMRGIHEQLRAHAGTSDPLARIAQDWRNNLRVLVLDEFFVTDIGDAMLLARLLERLFAEGVTLVTTSNTAPENLYADGLQRESFLPAIALLQKYCLELLADGGEDYRMRALTRSPVYHTPLDAQADAWLGQRWNELSGATPARAGNIQIEGRAIAVRGRGKSIVWFDFPALCEGPRGPGDYIEIAREFNTVLVGGIPHFDRMNEDAARRFVNLIDELYDRQVNLVCTAHDPPPLLYTGTRLAGAFERTASRLIEMRSAEYLATPHRA
ncbi:cell division protein ZapE [Stenotrophomonas sp. MMGLT7]|uniref:cell division protein ZapE n=1 Tax=Stenotrophomonas sp. MMGLT7 TaxID=2901227 RepID=UPI001E5DD70A|nr:cell division protein ZapE [Stenotrophomonas sp. MMGLT7]MCD7099162.1 cell division protein ZapE [Stenotrophomonas sp. MMGLT7]